LLMELKSIEKNLIQALDLQYKPVGVSLFGEGDLIHSGVSFFNENLKSYCQALTLAGKGQEFLLEKERMGCKLGTTVLGLEDEVDRHLDDGVLEKYGVGLFETEEASAETILKAPMLEKGKTRAVMIAPLSRFDRLPQVVVFTADSEQVMWLLYAVNYEKGGKMNLPQSGGALGGCSDITVLPMQKSVPNVTFLGLGCRLKSAIASSHLMMGIPGAMLETLHQHILDMAKPVAMLRNARPA
jgi:uncharacterized protein (DUF169 family)